MRIRRFGWLVCLVSVWIGMPVLAADEKPAAALDPAHVEFFEQKIRPILAEHCLECHGAKDPEANLRLDIRAGWMKGGDSGPAIRPGKPKESLLIRMVGGRPAKMPPETVLPQPLVDDLVKWVEMGAPDPRDGEIAVAATQTIDWEAARRFWAYQPVKAVEPPSDSRFKQPIDRFLAAAWPKAKVLPVDIADKRTRIRRATYTLTGLPPTLEEVRAFEADASPNAFEKVVDRLLAFPRYGEHQARQWLDVVRFAEDQFSKSDQKDANPWRYRDWVIDSYNSDMPYDRFVKLQIAADAIEGPQGDPQHLTALGFFALGPTYGFVNDNDRSSAEEWSDRIDVLTRGFLGLTVGCARCHDHKYDPIPTQDYYSLAGVLYNSRTAIVPVSPRSVVERWETAKKELTAAEDKAQEYLQAESDRLATIEVDKKLVDYSLHTWRWRAQKCAEPELKAEDYAASMGLDPKAFVRLDKYLMQEGRGSSHYLHPWRGFTPQGAAPAEPPAEVRALAELFREKAKENLATPLAKRNRDQQKDLFSENGVFPMAEANVLERASESWKKDYARLTAAVKAVADKMPPEPERSVALEDFRNEDLRLHIRGNPHKKGPQVPRQFLEILSGEERKPFGEGSGRKGLAEAIADPKNPLTARVMVNRIWQQHFGRGIVGTASNFGELGERPTHPELLDYLANRFVNSGWSIKKLHREILLTEAFSRAATAAPANLQTDPENRYLWRMTPRRLSIEEFRDTVLAAAGVLSFEQGGPGFNLEDIKSTRRTVYGKVSRKDLSKLLVLFDFADPNLTNDRRNESTLPQQMLFLMNSPFIVEHAKLLAARIDSEATPADKARRGYELALGRAPTEAEQRIIVGFLSAEDAPEDAGKNMLTRTERFAQTLLVGNDLFFVD